MIAIAIFFFLATLRQLAAHVSAEDVFVYTLPAMTSAP
jgi:hypothetical protein